MTDLERLARAGTEPIVLARIVPLSEFGSDILRWANAGYTVRHLRGTKMKTSQALFDEVAASLQFPYYFGQNWNAFYECFEDMEWLPTSAPVVIAIADADAILKHELDVQDFFWGSVSRAISAYANPITDGEWWDRPAFPFHVVVQCAESDLLRLEVDMSTAGLTLEVL